MNTIAYTCLLQKGRTLFYKCRFVFIYLFIAIALTQNTRSQTLAFPEANGFGRNATGGRGGSVIKVTNLNNSGAGSLRDAVTTVGTKTIVFEVGGTINLSFNLTINANTTIAGQTAPGDGILIKGGKIEINESNVIIRYLRMRPNGVGGDAISITAEDGTIVENVIIDHCSMSWASDENINIRTIGGGASTAIARNITIQNCLVGEAPYAMLVGGGRTHNVTVYNNLFALNQDRHIRSQGSVYLGNTYFDFEQINNINYGFDSNSNFTYGHKMSAINNHWVPSTEVTDDTIDLYKTLPEFGGVLADTDAYIAGNTVPTGHNEYENELNPYISGTPYASTGIIPVAAVDIETTLLSHVGASFPTRDAVDTRLIAHYNANDGSLNETRTFPTIVGGTAPIDTDDDGMPDTWETEYGLDINDPTDRNVVQSDGYTNLEYYLNNLFFLNDGAVNANAGQDQNICEGSSATLTASGGDTYLWSTGDTAQSITVVPNTTTTYSVTAFVDSESDTDEVIVNVNQIPSANAGVDQTICTGETITISASGGSSYLWSTGATSATINVSPNATITYSVTVSNNGCSDTDDILVTVNPSPTANAGNDVAISQGETTILTASGGDAYIWSTGETTESISVNPSTTTTYTLIALLNGCEDTDDVIVTIETEQVTANAGADVGICEGDSITLTASGGIDYLWSTGETTQSIVVNPSSTTNYTVIVSNDTSNDTDDVTVDVNPVPEVTTTNDATILEGNYITLSASGANNYEWSNGATQPNIAVSPNITTTYVVTGYINECYDVKDVTVSVVEQVVVDAGEDTSLCLGDEITLIANGSGAEEYLWNTGATTQSITVSPEEDTMYTVMASNSLDSDADEIIVTVNACQEIIPEDEEFSFKAYIDSRISDNILNVKLTGMKDQCYLYLFDISGKLIHTDGFDGNDGQEVIRTINTAAISDGVYIIKVTDVNSEHSKSIVIR